MPYYGSALQRGDYYGALQRGDPGGGLIPLLGRGILAAARLAGRAVSRAVGRHPVAAAAGGAGLVLGGEQLLRGPYGQGGLVVRPGMALAGRATAGYHLNRETYVTRGGGTSRWPQSVQVHEARTVEVKNRRMQVTNARAAVKAVRRLKGFARVARRAIAFTSPKPPKGRMYFRTKGKTK